jgi:bifunctional non-homologous end joining protein LigD
MAEVGCALRDLLERLELDCAAKTSGSKGLQVYVPLNSEVDFEVTKVLAHSIGLMLEKQLPSLVVTTMAKSERSGRVLIDWSQNDRAKTTVSVYSLRARPEPTASTPVTWEEVEGAVGDSGTPLVFRAPDVLERVVQHGDLFAPVLEQVQPIPGRVLDLVSGRSPR